MTRKRKRDPGHRKGCDRRLCTLGIAGDGADICRQRGWQAGTVLVGDEGWGDERMVITAVGERHILGRREADPPEHECMWTLAYRCWGPA